MAVAKLTVVVFLLLISAQTGQQQQPQCSVDNLPEFGDTDGVPDRDRFQAIVPAYTFQCTGRVTEWRACVVPGGSANEQYYIQFQVWRPTANGIEGCYELVGYNIPLDDAGEEGFLSPPGNDNDPLTLDRCVVLPVRENQQIEFQPGDVVGYYVDHFKGESNPSNPNNGGIQWIDSTEVTVYYREDLARFDIKTQYALSPLGPNPSSCGFQVSDATSNSHILISTAASAPIISLTFTTMMLASTVAPMLTSTSVVAPTPTLPPPGPAVASTSTPSPPQPVIPSTLTTTSVTLTSSLTTQPEMSPSVSPPATTPRVSNITILGSVLTIIIVAIAVFTVATVVISVLVCLKKRKRESELVDNVAYHSHNTELITSPNSAYNTVSTAIPTTTNEAYVATRIPTSPNTAYEVVQATAEERDIDTKANEAYVPTGIATSVNEAYLPVQSTSDNTQASHTVSTAIPTTTNEAYIATRIPTSPNTAYDNTPLYDYARPQ